MLLVNQLNGFNAYTATASAGKTVTWLYNSAANTTSGGSHTFSTTLGTRTAGSYLIVGVICTSGTGGTSITGVTVAGNAMTAVTDGVLSVGTLTNNECRVGLWIIADDSSTSPSIVSSYSTTASRANIIVWEAVGLSGLGAYDTGTDSTDAGSISLNTNASSFAVAVAGVRSSSSMTTTNLTERADVATTNHTGWAGDATTSGASLTADADAATGTEFAMVAASF